LDLDLAPSLAGTLALAPPPPSRFTLGQVDQPPMVTAQIPPPYPFLARRRGIEGWVRVRFLVDRQGQVRELTIVKAQPPGVFEDTVRRTLPRWRFRPGVKDGRPVDTWVETVIRFKLEGR
jgi:protein TonB